MATPDTLNFAQALLEQLIEKVGGWSRVRECVMTWSRSGLLGASAVARFRSCPREAMCGGGTGHWAGGGGGAVAHASRTIHDGAHMSRARRPLSLLRRDRVVVS